MCCLVSISVRNFNLKFKTLRCAVHRRSSFDFTYLDEWKTNKQLFQPVNRFVKHNGGGKSRDKFPDVDNAHVLLNVKIKETTELHICILYL